MSKQPILTASGEVLYGETPEDGIIAKFYGDPDLARTAAQSVNAFAALADHLGCDPAELESVDLVAWYEIVLGASRMPADSAIGSLVKVTATRELAQFDTVDRADKE